MERILLAIKKACGWIIWDVLTIIMLIGLLVIVLKDISDPAVKVALLILVFGAALLSLSMKYWFSNRQSGRDDVTGGKNKKEFERITKKLLRGNGEYVLVYANIDRFKLINETYGNDVGDQILRKIQLLLDNEVVRGETSGRIMADNFGMLMRFNTMKLLKQRLSRINHQMAELADEKGNPYGIVLYFGVYRIHDKNMEVSTMLEHANVALKKIGPSYLVPIGIYSKADMNHLEREKMLEMKMQSALEHRCFIPYLQPKYELETETIAGAEALVRWIDPKEGMIYPDEFIPLFEGNGFVTEVDLYMFEEICKLIHKWNEEGRRQIPISVNLSRSHFSVPNFFDEYENILKKYNIPPKSIEIELTESLFYNDLSALNDLVSRIHNAGCLCSIDDFGSGYSSLNMLKDVEVDALKLDRVFFENNVDKRGKDIIQSVIHLAQALELHTISEGVEERAQVEFLKQMNCDLIQGYVFAKPMPIPQFEELAFGEKAG